MGMHKLRWGMVSTFPPGTGSLNEYAHHFVRALRRKQEIAEVILFVDTLPDGKTYSDDAIGDAACGAHSELQHKIPQQVDEAAIRYVPCWRFNDNLNLWRLLRAIHSNRPDVVFFNIQFASFGDRKVPATLGLLAPALLRFMGVPTVVLLHNIMETVDLKNAGFADRPWLEWLIRQAGAVVTRLLLRADLVAVTIPKYVEILEEKYQAKNVLLAPHGSFEGADSVPNYALPEGPAKIMTFGKFGTYKRVETLLEAFALLQSRRQDPVELVIAGTDSPNAPAYLQSIATNYAHIPNVRYTGYVAEKDVPTIFGEAAAVIFPYTSTTGSSGVLHQAGDYGKAVVLPRIGDLAELIEEEGYAGEFFQPNDAESLADAIARILDEPAHRIQMGQQNYMAARGLPLMDVLDWYLLHIDTLLKQKRSRF